MLTGIFDSHAHYDDAAFDADRELLLQMLPQQGICAIMNIGCSIESARQSIALAKNFPYIYTAIGIHPEFAAETTERELAEIRQMIDDEQVYAVGEIGLDYHYGKESVQAQKRFSMRRCSWRQNGSCLSSSIPAMRRPIPWRFSGNIRPTVSSTASATAQKWRRNSCRWDIISDLRGCSPSQTPENLWQLWQKCRLTGCCWRRIVRIWHRYPTAESAVILPCCR